MKKKIESIQSERGDGVVSLGGFPRKGRLPPWLRRPLPETPVFAKTKKVLERLRLNTVCHSARCPNHWECWGRGTAAFMIGGDRCTRACRFCSVPTARPLPLDPTEPDRVAEAVAILRLRHVVITSVARDDLPDGGAEHFRRTIEAIRARVGQVVIEVLVPDFQGDRRAIRTVLAARPHIFNHNLETVRRITPLVRSKATYERSLEVLQMAKEEAPYPLKTKSGLMLGLGETEEELFEALEDLRQVDCDFLTLGQYLPPSRTAYPVHAYIPPEKFEAYGRRARKMGFLYVASGPLVRSSYQADLVSSTILGDFRTQFSKGRSSRIL